MKIITHITALIISVVLSHSLMAQTATSLTYTPWQTLDLNSLDQDWSFKTTSFLATSINSFPMNNNANAVMTINMYPGGFNHQIGFNGDGDIYERYMNGTWFKMFSEKNLNRGDADFIAKQITAKELFINSDESYPNGWGISHLYWKGHTLFLGSPKGWHRHNQFILRPGGSSSPGQICENYFSLDKALGVDNYETCISFATDGSANFIKNGNVLIGKTTQTNSTYKLDVAGKIRADEIVVNTTGADFVFEPTYKLRSLSELETFVRTNKHLPDIASAKEMQENGVSAGEMQAKLLQKVEELTLYVIELEKRIKDLETKTNTK